MHIQLEKNHEYDQLLKDGQHRGIGLGLRIEQGDPGRSVRLLHRLRHEPGMQLVSWFQLSI